MEVSSIFDPRLHGSHLTAYPARAFFVAFVGFYANTTCRINSHVHTHEFFIMVKKKKVKPEFWH